MTQQSLSSGQPISSKYTLGFSGVSMVPGPTQLIAMIVGRSGKGKSYFLQDCPNAFIINTDLSSTPGKGKKPRASIWPGLRSDGTPVEPNPTAPSDPEQGIPVKLTWKRVLEIRDSLIAMAKDNYAHRPRVVVLDTVDTALDLVRDYLVETAPPFKDGRKRTSFRDLNGKTAWPDAYDQIMHLARDLREAGYGFYFVAHLTDKYENESDLGTSSANEVVSSDGPSRTLIRNTLQMSRGFQGRIEPLCELIGVVTAKNETHTEDKPMKMPNGDPIFDPATKQPRMQKVTREVQRHYLSFSPIEFAGVVKKRVPLPDAIPLDADAPWDSFDNAYRSATSS